MNIHEATNDHLDAIFSIWLKASAAIMGENKLDMTNSRQLFSANFMRRSNIYNYWVATDANNNVIGWQSLSRFSNSILREHIYAESSTYIHHEHRHSGVGFSLIQHAIEQARINKLQFIVAFLIKDNAVTEHIRQQLAFNIVGEFPADDNLPPQILIMKRL